MLGIKKNPYIMKSYKSFTEQELNEKKWYWLLAVGGLVLGNMFFSRIETKKPKPTETVITLTPKEVLEEEKEINNEWIEEGRKDVIKKVKDGKLPNKDSLLYYIENCEIVLMPQLFKESHMLKNSIAGYLFLDGDDYIIINDTVNSGVFWYEYKVMAIRHEFYHLIDYHRLLENKPEIEINKNITPKEYEDILSDILGDSITSLDSYKPLDDKHKKYLSSETEIYSRYNNFKSFLYEYGYISSPSQDITRELWNSIFNGKFSQHYYDNCKSKDLCKKYTNRKEDIMFINSDFFDILPFIKKAKLKELNKLAYIPDNEKTKNLA